jgi:outer membrane lipoprotein carrier protein
MNKKIIACFLSIIFASPVWSNSASEHVQHKLTTIRTMKANFSQVVRTKRKKSFSSTGYMALSRPGRLLWSIQKPVAQSVIADGKRLWIYDVSLEQVTVKPEREGMGGVAGLFLASSHSNVAQYFDVTENVHGNMFDYDLRSKSKKASIQKVHLRFAGAQLVLLQLFDQLGQNTEIHFNNIQMNQALPMGIFNFRPPAGVDVIRQ